MFFDNLSVQHTPVPVLEETHYYPFGLTMAGISSKAAGGVQNRRKFNDGTELESGEFSDGSGMDLYATEFRSYDPQIGRFHQLDLLAEITEDCSPYSFCLNNPISLNDPLGLSADSTVPRGSTPQTAIDHPELGVTVVAPPNCSSSSSSTPSSYAFIAGSGGNALLEQIAQHPAKTATSEVGEGIADQIIEKEGRNLLRFGGTALLTVTATVWPLSAGPNVPNGDEMYWVRTSALKSAPVVRPAPLNPVSVFGVKPPDAELYTLRARRDGWYPAYTWGNGWTYSKWLQKGNIWKIGTTINGAKRYPNSFYENTGQGLLYTPEIKDPIDVILFAERMRLINYASMHNRQLPPGNTKLQ